MHLTMRQIALFESVARNLSFTKAARELFLTQPAVSIQIKHLEESVGAPLFEQIGKRIFLTAAGREVFLATQDVLARTKELERTLAEMRGGMVGNLDIAVVSAANYFAPHLLGAFLKLYPGVNVRLQVTNREEVIERLHDNKDDLVIMGQVPDAMVVEAHPFLENPLVLVAPPDHPLAGEKHIPINRLANEKFLVREAGSGTRKAMEQVFEAHRLPLRVAMELGSAEAVKHGVMAGLGLSVLSVHNLTLELAEGYLAALDVAGFPLLRNWYAVLLKGKKISLISKTFLEFLKTESALVLAETIRLHPPHPQLKSHRVQKG